MKESKSLQRLKKIMYRDVRPSDTYAVDLKGLGVSYTKDVLEFLKKTVWKPKKIGTSFGKNIYNKTLVRR